MSATQLRSSHRLARWTGGSQSGHNSPTADDSEKSRFLGGFCKRMVIEKESVESSGPVPTVEVELEEDWAYLSNTSPPVDPVLRGTTVVTLPFPTALSSLDVVLEGLAEAYGGDAFGYEVSVALQEKVQEELGNEVYEAGRHTFEFSFRIPSTTADTQRSQWGHVRHYVKARSVLASGEVYTSSPAPVIVIMNSTPSGELPTPLEFTFQHHSKDLGPVGLSFFSPNLTIASLCTARISLLDPPQTVTILAFNAVVTQAVEVFYKDGRIARPEREEHILGKVDMSFPGSSEAGICSCQREPDGFLPDPRPLVKLAAGEEFSHFRYCRLPCDDELRPTTLEVTETPIRVNHRVVLEVRYKLDGGDEMILAMGKPVTLSSCCCLVDALYLPTYSSLSPQPKLKVPIGPRCACMWSAAAVFKRDGEALKRFAPSSAAIPETTTVKTAGGAVDPAIKSPSWTNGGGFLTGELHASLTSDSAFSTFRANHDAIVSRPSWAATFDPEVGIVALRKRIDEMIAAGKL